MFTKLYLDSTNPKTTISQLFRDNSLQLLISVIFHTIIYALFLNMVYYIFYGSFLSIQINIRLVIALLIIMSLGYIARFYHVKDIYNAYHNDIERTRNHLDKLYISWVFIA
uniref:Uncharacterized protein n=1 Tax=viral metagenome TaxID=1070528 RepID=A0A6C0I012_9ZZZZ